MSPLIYLASPYTHGDPDVRFKRYMISCQVAAKLMMEGNLVFSPLAHSHPIADCMPDGWCIDHDFWKMQDEPYLERADVLVVLTIEGWKNSKGLRHEINHANWRKIPIFYIDPEEILNGSTVKFTINAQP